MNEHGGHQLEEVREEQKRQGQDDEDTRNDIRVRVGRAKALNMSRRREKQMRDVAVAEKALRTSSSSSSTGGAQPDNSDSSDPLPISASFCDFIEALVRWTYATRGWGLGVEHRTAESFVNLLQVTVESLVAALNVDSWPEIEQRSHDDHLAFLRQVVSLEKGRTIR